MAQVAELITKYRDLFNTISSADLRDVLSELINARNLGKRVFVFGNGGSAPTASHFASDLQNVGIKAISLNDNHAVITRIANDFGYEYVFAYQLSLLAQPNDTVIAISGSGNSLNVIRALEMARDMDAITIGLLGFDGGKAAGWCDLKIIVQSDDYGVIEGIHSCLTHIIVELLK